ncbi:E3 ubiquitin-protein ligase rbbp6 [Haplosporangium sp. Z 767]|nr:E3 ubiquitin-protein ligase rbbp6 [Haplosporangium sp. Z 767]
MSQVHYKFRSSKDYDSATFDGHSISVFDLKKEILIAKGLKGPDDLALTHAETGEEYYDDATLIPRNTSVLVARVPAKPGRGGAQRYLEGSGPIPRGGGMTRNVFERQGQGNNYDPMHMGGGAKVYTSTTSLVTEDGPPAPAMDASNMTEEERMKAVFEQQTSIWDKTQEGMASAPYRPLGKFQGATTNPSSGGRGAGGRGAPALSGPYQRQSMDQQQRSPPNTFVCHRCGKKGEHWIQYCPTNNDKNFEPMRIKKTTGIPRSFLKTVETDTLQNKKGVMVTQDGNLVVATTNDYEWKKFHEKSKGALTSDEAYATAPVPDNMKCPICHLLLKSAVQTPCCGTNFCDECIGNYLVQPPKGEEPFKCQSCRQHLVPDQLMPNTQLRQHVEQHLRDWAKNRRMVTDGSGVPTAVAVNSRGGSPNPDVMEGAETGSRQRQDSPSVVNSTGDTNNFMEGENSRIEAGQKRRLSIDHQGGDGLQDGDHDSDQASWKNKKSHVNSNHLNNLNSQNFNRNRPPMHGVGGMGPMDPAMMFPEGMPPGFIELMKQHDPTLFMDPAFMGSNGMPNFMMPGFMPPFGPEFGGMPGMGGPGMGGPGMGGPVGPGGPEMWGMGRGMPGLPPMGPGYPTPRIGFGDGTGAGRGRGRGRGGWQEQGNNANMRGRGQPQDFNQDQSQRMNQQPGGTDFDHAAKDPARPTGSNDIVLDDTTGADRRRSASNGHGRYDDVDDDIDMSKVPTGPRGARTPSPFDEADIPKGPKAGPDTNYDRHSTDRRSESPPRAPLADRVRNRSESRARSERDSHHRENSRRRDSRDRGSDRDKDSGRDRDRRREHDRDRDRSRDYERDRDRRRDSSKSRRDDRSRSSRYDRDRDDRRDSRRDDRKDDRRDDRKDDRREDSHRRSESVRREDQNDRYDDDQRIDRHSSVSRSDRGSSSSRNNRTQRSERSERSERENYHRQLDQGSQYDSDGDRGRHVRESSSTSLSSRSVDPQREYELKRQAAFGIPSRSNSQQSNSGSNSATQDEIVSFRGRGSNVQRNERDENNGGRANGRGGGYEEESRHIEMDYAESRNGHAKSGHGSRYEDAAEDDRVQFRRRSGMGREDLAVTGLVSNSARERERRERERRNLRD